MNRTSVPIDREYMEHWVETRSAIVNLDVVAIQPENTGNRFEFPGVVE